LGMKVPLRPAIWVNTLGEPETNHKGIKPLKKNPKQRERCRIVNRKMGETYHREKTRPSENQRERRRAEWDSAKGRPHV